MRGAGKVGKFKVRGKIGKNKSNGNLDTQIHLDELVNQSVNQRFLKWPKWYATARTTTGNKTVGTEMS